MAYTKYSIRYVSEGKDPGWYGYGGARYYYNPQTGNWDTNFGATYSNAEFESLVGRSIRSEAQNAIRTEARIMQADAPTTYALKDEAGNTITTFSEKAAKAYQEASARERAEQEAKEQGRAMAIGLMTPRTSIGQSLMNLPSVRLSTQSMAQEAERNIVMQSAQLTPEQQQIVNTSRGMFNVWQQNYRNNVTNTPQQVNMPANPNLTPEQNKAVYEMQKFANQPINLNLQPQYEPFVAAGEVGLEAVRKGAVASATLTGITVGGTLLGGTYAGIKTYLAGKTILSGAAIIGSTSAVSYGQYKFISGVSDVLTPASSAERNQLSSMLGLANVEQSRANNKAPGYVCWTS